MFSIYEVLLNKIGAFSALCIPIFDVIKNRRLENHVVGYRSKDQIEVMM